MGKALAVKGDSTVTKTSCHSIHLDSEGNHVPCDIEQFEGTILEGSNNVKSGNKGIAREGDEVLEICSCCGGGRGRLVSSTQMVKVNGGGIIKDGDKVLSHEGSEGTVTASAEVNVKG